MPDTSSSQMSVTSTKYGKEGYILNFSSGGINISRLKITYLGVRTGVLSLPGVLGVDMLALLVDCGVLCLPALPGVLWVLAKVVKKSLFIPLCLDVALQVWHVAIWDKTRREKVHIH